MLVLQKEGEAPQVYIDQGSARRQGEIATGRIVFVQRYRLLVVECIVNEGQEPFFETSQIKQ